MSAPAVEAVPVAETFRRSALEAVDCPARYKAIYEDGVGGDSDPAIRGRAFHDVAKVYIRRLADLKRTSDHEELERAFEAVIAVTKLPPHLVAEVKMLTQRWGESFELNLDAYVLAEETQVVHEAAAEWTPDLVYAHADELEQKDFKTYWVGMTEAQVKEQFQAQVYVWLASKVWPGFPRYRFTFSFPRLRAEASAVWEPWEVDAVEAAVRSRIAIINQSRQTGDWPAIPGPHCRLCHLKCPKMDHMALEVQRVQDAHVAQEVAGELLILEQAVKARKAALRGWCQTEGPVNVKGVTFGFKPGVTTKFPSQGVIEVLAAHEIPHPTFTVSASALSTYLKTKRYAHLRDDLMAVADVQTTQSFTSWTPSATQDEPATR